MSQIGDKGRDMLIQGPESLRNLGLYETMVESRPMFGVECEMAYYSVRWHEHSETMRPVAVDMAVHNAIVGGLSHSKENVPSIIESVSPPFSQKETLAGIVEKITSDIKIHVRAAAAQRAYPSPFGNLPQAVFGQEDIIHGNEPEYQSSYTRYQSFSKRWLNDPAMIGVHDYFTTQAANQVSVTGAPEALFEIARLSLALGPFMMLLTGTNPGFVYDRKQCSPVRIDGDPRLYARQALGRNGGYPDFLFAAQNPHDYLDRHIHHVITGQHMFAYWDENGVLSVLPPGQFISFHALPAKLQTLQNYLQAQSMSWNLVNWAPVESGGQIKAHRIELCVFNSGPRHQPATAALIAAALMDENFREVVKTLLKKRLGIAIDDMQASKAGIESLYVRARKGRDSLYRDLFLENSFARDFAAALIKTHAGKSVDSYLKTLETLTREGPDWHILRRFIQSPADMLDFMVRIPDLLKENPALQDPSTCLAAHKDIFFTGQEKASS